MEQSGKTILRLRKETIALRVALVSCVKALNNLAPVHGEYWEAVHAAEQVLEELYGEGFLDE